MTKILLIEDDQSLARMYHRTFSLEGYDVQLAGDGEEGLIKAQSFLPTLIMMDVMMPKKDGMEVMEALKLNPQTANIPVIILTNLVGEQERDAILAKGATKYLIKSEHEPQQVVDIVKQVLASLPAAG